MGYKEYKGLPVDIAAINKDKQANIFSVAHFGIVEDYKEVLPTLTVKLKELLSK